MDDPTAVRTLARSGYSGFHLAVEARLIRRDLEDTQHLRAENQCTTAD